MWKPRYAIFLFLVIAGSFLAGTWYSKHSAGANPAAAGRRILYYHDPMHPAYKSDKPGIAPDCGMQLEPVYADDAGSREGTEESISPPGTIQVSPERQQLIGVKLATVKMAAGSQSIRVLGRVVPDETRIYRINAAVDGWVRETLPVTTGSLVKKDQVLANIYAPESFSAMKAYLYGLSSLDRFQASAKETKEQLDLTDATIEGYRNALRNLGMSDCQLDEIRHTREGSSIIEIRATAAGFIIARNITLGQRFEKGTELYRIADLSHVWIVADVFGCEAQSFKHGSTVRVNLPDQGLSFRASVSDVLPQFDPASRTNKIRLETDNPGYALRPDMFVDIEVPVRLPEAITVPGDALLDTGLHKTVFVARGNGVFEPRRVETGWRLGDNVEIVSGLKPGERVAVSGTFLIDSESRMKAAAAGIYGEPATDPVCGMNVREHKATAAGKTSAHGGRTYYFCSDDCKQKFDKNPEKYIRK
ncbi:MAG: efflux RND transporter periplasmic adaptor subunit [Acidobacteriia bacterium]|nr:efflux RND transporter periplasmic adaptor subunit [Terriglobia bacterium]